MFNQQQALSSENKTLKYSNSIISNDDQAKLKAKTEGIDPMKLIEEALQLKNKEEDKEVMKNQNDYLDQLRKTSINNFLESIKLKAIADIQQEFEKKTDEYNRSTKLFIEKKNQECLELNKKLLSAKSAIQDLDNQIVNIRYELKVETEKNKKSEIMISQLSIQLEEFKKIKPILDEFLKAYPDERPEVIIADFKEKKGGIYQQMEEMQNLHMKLHRVRNERKEESERNRQTNEEYYLKMKEQDKDIKDKVFYFTKQINDLKCELVEYKEYKAENLKLSNMLFRLYNMLIERFSIERGITVAKEFLPVEEKDFKCDIFCNNEISNYIKTMITLSNEHRSGEVLREVIAYCNMLVRIFAKEKIEDKFNPRKCFKAIKDLVERMSTEKIQLLEDKSSLADRINVLEAEVVSHKNRYKELESLCEMWEKKFNDQFKEKLTKIKQKKQDTFKKRKLSFASSDRSGKNLLNESNDYDGKIVSPAKLSPNSPIMSANYDLGNFVSSQAAQVDSSKMKEISTTMKGVLKANEELKFRPKSSLRKSNSEFTLGSAKKDLFVTDNAKKRLNMVGNTVNIGSFVNSGTVTTRPQTGLMSSKGRQKSENSIFSKIHSKDKKSKVIPWSPDNFKSQNAIFELDSNQEEKIEEDLPTNRKIYYSKNSDKLLKKAVFKPISENMKGFGSMLHQTNNLMLYRSKMKNLLNIDEYRTDTNTFNLQSQSLNKQIDRFQKIVDPNTNIEAKNKNLHENLLNKIDNMIDKLGRK